MRKAPTPVIQQGTQHGQNSCNFLRDKCSRLFLHFICVTFEMTEKLYDYIGLVGVFHAWKESFIEQWQNFKDKYSSKSASDFILQNYGANTDDQISNEDFSHIHR